MSENYTDLAAIVGNGELGIGVIETEDFSTSFTTPVGDYITRQRAIKVNRKPDGKVSFEVTLNGGVENPETGKVFEGGKYPLRTWLSTTLYTQTGREGQTSSVAEYLRAAGFNPKGMAEAQLIEALVESQNTPLKVFIGRTDRSVKGEDGKYTGGGNLKTKDFKKADGTYAESVSIEGQTFKAKAKVGSFSKL